jgi:S1-C subfamily serine protease
MRWLVAILAAIAVAIAAVAAARSPARSEPRRGVVRIVMKSASGTGFFVAGPDAFAYVVTAYHVVASGEPILVERMVGDGTPYVEAYPEVDVVAFDSELDLAVLRIDHVRADHFTSLALATVPVTDEAIESYGFPASSLSRATGMMSKPGKVLGLVKLPSYDGGAIVREDAVDGLLISSEIEPGFSGGPTCNARGEVVGVNVTKDLVHRAQNGAVSVTAVRELLGRIKPVEITPAAVQALLARVQTEYLLLPVERRTATPAHDFVSTTDLPRLEQLIVEVHQLDNDTARDPKTKLSGQALLGVAMMRLPGHPLETYTAPATRRALDDCLHRQRALGEFFGKLAPGDDDRAPVSCTTLAVRPMIWDLTALALQWEGKVRDATVIKVETIDADAHQYRAQVRLSGVDHLVDIWLSTSGGRLRLALFDNRGFPAGLTVTRSVAASAFEGTWHRSEPRTSRASGLDVDTDETLVISVATDGAVSVTHDLRRHMYGRVPCGGGKLDLGLEQAFTGTLDQGSVVAFRHAEAKAIGADMGRCWRAFTYQPDQVAVFKLVDNRLMMYRTDGVAFPETAEFHR